LPRSESTLRQYSKTRDSTQQRARPMSAYR
jgi:hypothetical protein